VVFDKAAAAAKALRAAADGKGLELELPEPDQPYGLKGAYSTLYPCPCSARARVCPRAVCPAAAAPRLPTPRTAGALRRCRAGAWRARRCLRALPTRQGPLAAYCTPRPAAARAPHSGARGPVRSVGGGAQGAVLRQRGAEAAGACCKRCHARGPASLMSPAAWRCLDRKDVGSGCQGCPCCGLCFAEWPRRARAASWLDALSATA